MICNARVLTDCWTDFIDHVGKNIPGGWQWFTTLTFKSFNVGPESASKAWNRWLRKLNKECFGNHYQREGKGIVVVRATEMQQREVIHFHALMGGGLGNILRKSYEAEWNKENGFAFIKPYRGEQGAKRYIAKYVSKGGELDVSVPPGLRSKVSELPYSCKNIVG